MFDNRFNIYYRLNTINSFDVSWVANYYKLFGMNQQEVYQKYISEKLKGNNLQTNSGWRGLADCMIEHTFERIVFDICKLLNKQIELINLKDDEHKSPIVINGIHFNRSPIV